MKKLLLNMVAQKNAFGIGAGGNVIEATWKHSIRADRGNY
jgi:hypothetical protein